MGFGSFDGKPVIGRGIGLPQAVKTSSVCFDKRKQLGAGSGM